LQRSTDRALRIDRAMPRPAREREEHVTELLLDARLIARGRGLVELAQLFVDLRAHAFDVRPVEAEAARLLAHAHRTQEPRHRERHAVERTLLALALLLALTRLS